MSVTVAQLKERFPEFTSADDALIQARLDQALRSIDVIVWGELADDGQATLAAHLLALSPFGTQAGLRQGEGAESKTIYQDTIEELQRRVGGSYRTVLA
jgi:hypothetical protein